MRSDARSRLNGTEHETADSHKMADCTLSIDNTDRRKRGEEQIGGRLKRRYITLRINRLDRSIQEYRQQRPSGRRKHAIQLFHRPGANPFEPSRKPHGGTGVKYIEPGLRVTTLNWGCCTDRATMSLPTADTSENPSPARTQAPLYAKTHSGNTPRRTSPSSPVLQLASPVFLRMNAAL